MNKRFSTGERRDQANPTKFLALLLALLMLPWNIASAREDTQPSVRIYCDGINAVDSYSTAYIDGNGRTMVSLYELSNYLRPQSEDWYYVVQYHSRKALYNYGGRALNFTAGEYIFYIDDIEYEMDTCVVEKDNDYFVPLRHVAEAFGFDVKWNASQRSIELTSAQARLDPFYWSREGSLTDTPSPITIKSAADFDKLPAGDDILQLKDKYNDEFFSDKALFIIPITNNAGAYKHLLTQADARADKLSFYVSSLISPYFFTGSYGKEYHYAAIGIDREHMDKPVTVINHELETSGTLYVQDVGSNSDIYELLESVYRDSRHNYYDSRHFPEQAFLVDSEGQTSILTDVKYDESFFKDRFILYVFFYHPSYGKLSGLESISADEDVISINLSHNGVGLLRPSAMGESSMLFIFDPEWAGKEILVKAVGRWSN